MSLRRLQKIFSRYGESSKDIIPTPDASSPSTGTAWGSVPRTSPTSATGTNRRSLNDDVIRCLLDTYGSLVCEEDFTAGSSTLSSALEHSRKVMHEEKAKFQYIWQLPRIKRITSPEKRVLQLQEDPRLLKLLRIHKHSAGSSRTSRRQRHKQDSQRRSRSMPEVDWGGSKPTLNSTCDNRISENQPQLMLNLPARGVDVDFEKFGYHLVSFLAEGSLGKLHLVTADDDPAGQLWVAKIVDLTTLIDPAEATQALLEAELLRRLKHPNIVEYRNSFIHDQHLVIIMEFCSGGDLHSHLIKRRETGWVVEEQQVFKWVHQMCSGLAFMHRNNVLHCDVKSSNVFLDADSVAKIGDLGIAKELSRGAQALSPIRCPRGTPVYMSPEMCQRAALTERSDCWAMGCILYEICNLHHAFGSNIYAGRIARDTDNDSVISAATFLPGVTHRTDASITSRQILHNIRGDLKRIKRENANKSVDAKALKDLRLATCQLSYWGGDSLTFPQVLPGRYCPLLNYMVCAMLEPRPADRPTLSEVLQLIEAASGATDAIHAHDDCSSPNTTNCSPTFR